jgi:DNA-binding NarL/FixJ family response regulator
VLAKERTMTDNDSRIRILIADDCTLFREGLAELCRRRGLDVVGLAADGQEAVELSARHAPDVVLMDLEMPDMDGVAATAAIAARPHAPHVIVLTAHREDHYVFDAIKAGAVGYLLKCVRSVEVADAVAAVQRGNAVVDAGLAAKVLAEFRRLELAGDKPGPEGTGLTEGEMAVLQLVAQGRSNAEIAHELGVAPATVANRMREIFRKLHVASRTQAALVALQRGWADIERA